MGIIWLRAILFFDFAFVILMPFVRYFTWTAFCEKAILKKQKEWNGMSLWINLIAGYCAVAFIVFLIDDPLQLINNQNYENEIDCLVFHYVVTLFMFQCSVF